MKALAIALVACHATPATPPPANAVPGAPISHAPFVIGNAIVGEDGHVIRRLPNVPDGAIAEPIGPHRYAIEGLIVDTEADTIKRAWPTAAFEGDKLTRYGADGHPRWQQDIKGVRSVRPPDVAVGDNRVVGSVVGEIHAFDDATGKPVWSARSEGFSLATMGHALLSVSCNQPTHDHALIANDLASGAELWRAQLRDGCDPRVAVTDRYAIVVEEGGNPLTLVFDAGGKLVLQLDEETLGRDTFAWGGSYGLGGDTVLVTTKHVLRFDPAGHVVWQRPTLKETFVGADAFAELPGGDLLIGNYGAISDSGVDLVRLRASDGEIVWRVNADALGVAHSEYYHRAYVEVRGDVIYVVSQGSGGGFLEKRSVATGARLLRCVRADPCTP